MPLEVRDWTGDCGAHHDGDVNAAETILKFSTAGNAGSHARGVSKNVSDPVSGTHEEARAVAAKAICADRMDRAA